MIHFITAIPDRITALPARGKVLVALVSGIAGAFAMAPYHLWFLLIPGLSLFYIVFSSTKSTKSAFALSWLFGAGYFTAGLWWIGNALLVEGNEYKWAWPLAVLGLPVMLALFPAICLGLTKKYIQYNKFSGFLAFIALLSACEWLRGHLFTGFPWNLFGYAWGGVPEIIQIVSVGGIYLLTLLSVFWFSVLGFVCIWPETKNKKSIVLALVLLSAGGVYGYGSIRLASYTPEYHPDLRLHLVQANIPQHEKWDRAYFYSNFEKHIGLSANETDFSGQTLVIWPETTLTYHHLNYEQSRTDLQKMLGSYTGPAYLMAGMLRKKDNDYMNSLALYDTQLRLKSAYDKSHLVPFGEYIPLQKYIPLETVTSFGGFKAGDGAESITTDNIPSYSPLVCYEIIFPGKVTDRKNRPEWILNVTNDGWYGNSPGPYQHLSMAVFRAVEEGIPVVRAAGTGISAVIDPLGHITKRIPYNETDVITSRLPNALSKMTLFAKYGNIPFFAFMIFLIMTCVFQIRVNNKQDRL